MSLILGGAPRARRAARGLAAALAGAPATAADDSPSALRGDPRRPRSRGARRRAARGDRGRLRRARRRGGRRRAGRLPDPRDHRRGGRCSAPRSCPLAVSGARRAATGGEPRGVARRGRSPRRVRARRHVASRQRRRARRARAGVDPGRVRGVRRDYGRTGNFVALPRAAQGDARRSRRRSHPRDPPHGTRGRRQRRHVGAAWPRGVPREDAALRAEVVARQSWIRNAARLGVAAPWLLLLVLASRHETLVAYDSAAGAALILVGVAVTLVAYRAMVALGRLPEERRWLR